MRIPIEMQRLGPDMETGTILAWTKQVGSEVTKGDVIVEVDTEKVTMEMEALDSGTLVEIVHDVDAEVTVGDVIGYLELAE